MSTGELRLPMARIDRIWRGRTVVAAIGPISVPSRDSVIAALSRLAAAGPEARVGLRFDPGSPAHWTYRRDDLLQWFDSCVHRLPDGADLDMDALLTRLGTEPMAGRPIRVYLGERHLLVRYDHSLVDARLTFSLPCEIVAMAEGGEMPRWATTPVRQNPLRAALRATFPTTRKVRTVARQWRGERAARVGVDSGRSVDPIATTPFEPRPIAVNEFGPQGRTRAMAAWTHDHAPGAAPFASILACIRQALDEHGVGCSTGVHLLYDLRRYLPRERHLTGNFAIGVETPVDVRDPAQFTAAVTHIVRTGRPLLAAAASTLLVGRSAGGPPPEPTRVPAARSAQLAYSYVGAKRLDGALPWLGEPGERCIWGRADPAGPTAITLFAAIVDRRLAITASFHASVFDAELIRAALRRVHEDPIGLLTRSVHSARTDTCR